MLAPAANPPPVAAVHAKSAANPAVLNTAHSVQEGNLEQNLGTKLVQMVGSMEGTKLGQTLGLLSGRSIGSPNGTKLDDLLGTREGASLGSTNGQKIGSTKDSP